MKIQLVSDVHTEKHLDRGICWAENYPINGDVLVLAGDMVSYINLKKVLSILCARAGSVPILFVCGNHEYWGSNRGSIHNGLQDIANKFSNFHHLNNDVIVIDEQRFVGTTLWWKCPPSAARQAHEFKTLWSDAQAILGYKNWIDKASTKARAFLTSEIEEGDVIVTHHSPSIVPWQETMAHKENWDDKLYFWYNDLDSMIVEKKAKLWMYGHTHAKCDITIGETRVVTCPHGYVWGGKGKPNIYQIIEV